jgi:hypothetical protein
VEAGSVASPNRPLVESPLVESAVLFLYSLVTKMSDQEDDEAPDGVMQA